MLESWNDGFKETSIQNAYYFIDFLILMEYFSGKTRTNQKIDAWRASSKKVDSTFFCRIVRFPLFIPNILSEA
jgi:hypothetical protein